MKKNVGGTDRFIRIFIAIAFITLFYTNMVAGTVGYVLLAMAAVLILTSLINFCPLYTVFGITTCKLKK